MIPINISPGRELDRLIAQYVFKQDVTISIWGGRKKYSVSTLGLPDYMYTDSCPEGELRNAVPTYSTDIAAAWEIVGELESFSLGKRRRAWYATFCSRVAATVVGAFGESPAHAICLAALKAYIKE